MTLCSFFCKDVENELDLETENMNFFVNKRNSTDRAKSRFGSADGCIGRIQIVIRNLTLEQKLERENVDRNILKEKKEKVLENQRISQNHYRIYILVEEKRVDSRNIFKVKNNYILKKEGNLVKSIKQIMGLYLSRNIQVYDILQPYFTDEEINRRQSQGSIKFRDTDLLKNIFSTVLQALKAFNYYIVAEKKTSTLQTSNIRMSMNENIQEEKEEEKMQNSKMKKKQSSYKEKSKIRPNKIDVCLNWPDLKQEKMRRQAQKIRYGQ